MRIDVFIIVCLLSAFLGYEKYSTEQQHKAVVADLRNTINKERFEKNQYKRDYGELEKIQIELSKLDSCKVLEKLSK